MATTSKIQYNRNWCLKIFPLVVAMCHWQSLEDRGEFIPSWQSPATRLHWLSGLMFHHPAPIFFQPPFQHPSGNQFALLCRAIVLTTLSSFPSKAQLEFALHCLGSEYHGVSKSLKSGLLQRGKQIRVQATATGRK